MLKLHLKKRQRRTKEGIDMKKRLLLVISIIALIVVSATMMFACASSGKFDGKSYEKMEKYYAKAKTSVQKCEETLDALMSTVKASSYTATISLERTYFSNADDNVAFKGTKVDGGYDKNKDEQWLVSAVDYVLKYNNGNYIITAKVYPAVASDSYDKNNKGEATTYTYKSADPAAVGTDEYKYCVEMMYGVIFGQFTEDAFLEAYAVEATKGFRFVTHMMQYQIVRAFAYDNAGKIDYANVINYEANKDKTLYTTIEESESGDLLTDEYEAAMKADDVSFWEAYGEDITYNFYKTAAVYNDRVTMTYKNKTKELDTYEYYGERVLPYYTQKNDFKKYNVLKARVADYTHFVASFEYGAVEIA